MKIILIFFNLFLSLSLLAQSQEKLSPGQSIQASLKQTGYELLMPWLLVGESVGELWGGYKYKQNFKEQTNPDHLESWPTLWGSGSTVGKIHWQNIVPPKDVTEVLTKTGKDFGPVETSYLAYRKLYNKTVDENNFLSNGISWGYRIIRFHQAENDNNKTGAVTGWILDGGADYQTLGGAYEGISRVFTGHWSVSKEDDPMHIVWELIGKDGKTHDTEGFERFVGKLIPDGDTIKGQWVGYISRLQDEDMKTQYGPMDIMINVGKYHSFNMEDVFLTWDDEKVKEQIGFFLSMESYFGADYFPHFFSIEDQEQLIAYYVHKAWECYAENLPPYIKSKKGDILDFEVHLKHQFFSKDKFGNDGQKLTVPMRYEGPSSSGDPWILYISTGTFLTDMVENKKQFKSRLSLIAHEILGHGIFFRYYWPFIEKESETLFKENSKSTSLLNKLQLCITKESAKTAIKEGLAVAVEYSVYQKEQNMCINLEKFIETRYPSEQAAMYRLGVMYLKEKGIIDDKGELNFNSENLPK